MDRTYSIISPFTRNNAMHYACGSNAVNSKRVRHASRADYINRHKKCEFLTRFFEVRLSRENIEFRNNYLVIKPNLHT